MKLYSFLLIALFGFNTLFSQELIVDSGVVLKKGVYRTFDEFKYNNPSITFDGILSSGYRAHGFLLNRRVKYYGIGKILEGSQKSTDMFGFCDGEKVYIRTNQFIFSSTNFVEVQSLGRYSYFEKIKVHPFFYLIIRIPGLFRSRTKEECMIDINNGTIYEVKKSTLREIFSGDTNIVADYERTKKGVSSKGEIIKKYAALYRHEIDYSPYIDLDELAKLIYRLPPDTTIADYKKRILSYSKNTAFNTLKVLDKSFKNGSPKYFGIWAKHDKGYNLDYPYDIGTWYHFYENGQLKEEVNYNLLGKKNGRNIEYDDQGKVINELIYVDGVLVQ
jgi:hypothetical protein